MKIVHAWVAAVVALAGFSGAVWALDEDQDPYAGQIIQQVVGQPVGNLTISGETVTITGGVLILDNATTTATTSTAPALDPQNAAWAINLAGLLVAKGGAEADLTVMLERKDGQWVAAIASAPEWNRAPHEANAKDLVFDPKTGAITGKLAVTLAPDAWVPEDHRKVTGEIVIKAKLEKGKITGGYAGKLDGDERTGALAGELMAPEDVKNCEVNLNLEDVLTWGEPHERRMEFAFERRDGKHKNLAGKNHKVSYENASLKYDLSKIKLQGDQISGDIPFSITDNGGNMRRCTLSLKGVVIGPVTTGTFTCKLGEDGAKSEGRFRGYVYPLEK